jgi:sarcosine oxidase gamma subunit
MVFLMVHILQLLLSKPMNLLMQSVSSQQKPRLPKQQQILVLSTLKRLKSTRKLMHRMRPLREPKLLAKLLHKLPIKLKQTSQLVILWSARFQKLLRWLIITNNKLPTTELLLMDGLKVSLSY